MLIYRTTTVELKLQRHHDGSYTLSLQDREGAAVSLRLAYIDMGLVLGAFKHYVDSQ